MSVVHLNWNGWVPSRFQPPLSPCQLSYVMPKILLYAPWWMILHSDSIIKNNVGKWRNNGVFYVPNALTTWGRCTRRCLFHAFFFFFFGYFVWQHGNRRRSEIWFPPLQGLFSCGCCQRPFTTRPRTHIPPHIFIQSKAYSRGLYYASFSAFGRAYLVDQSTAETMSTHLRLFSLQFLERFNVTSIFF